MEIKELFQKMHDEEEKAKAAKRWESVFNLGNLVEFIMAPAMIYFALAEYKKGNLFLTALFLSIVVNDVSFNIKKKN